MPNDLVVLACSTELIVFDVTIAKIVTKYVYLQHIQPIAIWILSSEFVEYNDKNSILIVIQDKIDFNYVFKYKQ